MSTTTSASVASAPTNGCAANLYDTPVHDAVCALPYSKANIKIMEACCGDTDIVSYYDNCGLYCLAIDQTVGELSKCFIKEGAADSAPFCRGNTTATATATSHKIAATADATVINAKSTGTDASESGSSSSGTSSSGSSKSTSSDSAAPGVKAQPVVSTLGLALGALLFSATAFGAFQI